MDPFLHSLPDALLTLRAKLYRQRILALHKALRSNVDVFRVVLTECDLLWEEAKKASPPIDSLQLWDELVKLRALAFAITFPNTDPSPSGTCAS